MVGDRAVELREPSLPVSGAPGVKFPSAFPLDMMSTVVPAPPVKVRPVVLKVMLVTFQFPSRQGLLPLCWALLFLGLWLVWCL